MFFQFCPPAIGKCLPSALFPIPPLYPGFILISPFLLLFFFVSFIVEKQQEPYLEIIDGATDLRKADCRHYK